MTAEGVEPPLCRVLVVEDSPSDFTVLKAHLEDSGSGNIAVSRASTLRAALQLLAEACFDAVLVDLGLPDSDGLETFERVSQAAGSTAVIVLTGQDDAELAERAVRNGAQDYLVKGDRRHGDTFRAVTYAIRRQHLLDELERARVQQLEAKDRFLSHVSHELRSPLAVVHQFGSLLLDGIGGPLNEEQASFNRILMRNVGQLQVMIDDLLDVTRARGIGFAITRRRVALTELLTETVASYGPLAEGHELALNLDCNALPEVSADPDRVREVLGNLLQNAVKFTPRYGRIDVSAAVDGATVRISVRDTGRGISASDLPRIFDQFFQAAQPDEASRNGLGLGLFISRDLILRQGGEMTAESAPGQGTSISFTLSLAGPAEAVEVSP
jgi:signal transduction histidine kinase